MITYYNRGRIEWGSMTNKKNGIYIGYYGDFTGIKIGETSELFTKRWSQIDGSSRTGFRGLYYYEIGDYGEATTTIRKVMEILVRRRVSIYAANHKNFYNFQGDSFICSTDAGKAFMNFMVESSTKWDTYFARLEKKITAIVFNMINEGRNFKTQAETLAYIILSLENCTDEGA